MSEYDGPERRANSTLIYEMRETLKRVDDNLTLIQKLITGNGDPSKGFIIRLDRTERFIGAIIRILWIGAVPIVAGSLVLIWNVAKTFGHQ